MILCGTKNGSSMGLLEEPFEELIVKSVPPLLPLGYLMFSTNIVLSSGLQKGYGVNHKILLTLIYINHSSLGMGTETRYLIGLGAKL